MIGSSFIKHWNFTNEHYSVVNKGMSGLSSEQLFSTNYLQYLQNIYKKSNIIFFYSGANDIDRNYENPDNVIYNNIHFLEFLLHSSPASSIFVFSLLKSPLVLEDPIKTKAITYINQQMRLFCKNQPQLIYIDYNRSLHSPEYFMNDNHLNYLGYQQIEKKLVKML